MKRNIFTGSFTAPELSNWLQEDFCPESFSITVYGIKNQQFGALAQADVDNRVWCSWGSRGNSSALRNTQKLYLYDRVDYSVYQGDENIYIHFLVEDKEANYYYVSWGYKVGDIEIREDHGKKMLELVTLLHTTIHQKLIKYD